MTPRALEKIIDKLAEQHGLSPQLTAAWLRDSGYTARAVKPENVKLIPQQIERLIAFARI